MSMDPTNAQGIARARELIAEARAGAAEVRRLCAHADDNGEGAHWLAPGEACPKLEQQR